MLTKIILYCIVSMAIMMLFAIWTGDLNTDEINKTSILKILIFAPIFAPITLVILLCFPIALMVAVIGTLFNKERVNKMTNKTKAKLKMLYLIWKELDDAETVVTTNKKGVSTHIKRDCMFPVVQPTLKTEFKPSFNSVYDKGEIKINYNPLTKTFIGRE